jgi:hypothetical protein
MKRLALIRNRTDQFGRGKRHVVTGGNRFLFLSVVLAATLPFSTMGIASATGRDVVRGHVDPSSANVSCSTLLGARPFAPNGAGFGTCKPRHIFNGGDPSGDVVSIKWKLWGSKDAIGFGQTSIFRSGGGYYPNLVRVELRATDLGHCPRSSSLSYRHLEAREPARPGGPLGPWFAWSGASTICAFP